jgi:hypothetical protein
MQHRTRDAGQLTHIPTCKSRPYDIRMLRQSPPPPPDNYTTESATDFHPQQSFITPPGVPHPSPADDSSVILIARIRSRPPRPRDTSRGFPLTDCSPAPQTMGTFGKPASSRASRVARVTSAFLERGRCTASPLEPRVTRPTRPARARRIDWVLIAKMWRSSVWGWKKVRVGQ